jgi:hypothetical protein
VSTSTGAGTTGGWPRPVRPPRARCARPRRPAGARASCARPRRPAGARAARGAPAPTRSGVRWWSTGRPRPARPPAREPSGCRSRSAAGRPQPTARRCARLGRRGAPG